jgi:hypothetical protein
MRVMRQYGLAFILIAIHACFAQQVSQRTPETAQAQAAPAQDQAAPAQDQAAPAQDNAAPMRTEFQVRYINGSDVYVNGGRTSGLAEGTSLVLKQDPTKAADDPTNKAIEPGIIARLKVISVASTSAVCEAVSTGRALAVGDTLVLPDSEVEELVAKNTLGNTRKYPMVISFSKGDPMDEEVRNAIPRPPLPEVNMARGRIGFDMSLIQELGQGGGSSKEYGVVVRADFARLFGTHWNLTGYWRGEKQISGAPAQASVQDLINRTYLMSLAYINPDSAWTAGIGRLYLPWASSLETIDGAYVARKLSSKTLLGVFAGSTPDPTAWNYDPHRKIGGSFFNVHGGNFDSFHYSSTAGVGIALLGWKTDRPFVFTENSLSYKRYFNLFEAMQVDRPTPNPSTPAVGTGIGESLVSLRIQVHPRVAIDVSDTYFRDVPTYDPVLVGTGLLDKYLYQGLNGGVRATFPLHLTGYFSLGRSSESSDTKSSLNELFGVTMANIWKTGLQADARYSKFDSAFAAGTYRTITLTRDLGERFTFNLQGGSYIYNSSLAANSNSNFINLLCDMNLGAKFFLESAFTSQRGGTLNYNQWTTAFGYRFDNRSKLRRKLAHENHP